MLRSGLVCAALVAALAPTAAAAGDSSTRLIEIIGERQPDARAAAVAPLQVYVVRRKACGSKVDNFFCGAVSRTASESKLAYAGAPLRVSADAGANVIVTWSGTLYCAFRAEASDASAPSPRTDFVVDLAIKDGTSNTILLGEEGSTRVGRRDYADADRETFAYYPVTLTRTFAPHDAGETAYRLQVAADIRAGYGFCDVLGGAMSATVVSGGE